MTRDLADRIAAVGGDAMAKALLAVSDGDQTLRVTIPGYVVDAARDDVVLSCRLACCLAGVSMAV